jgi:hypothetical protein
MLPSQFLELDRRERAFVMASIDIKVDNDKKEAEKVKSIGRR